MPKEENGTAASSTVLLSIKFADVYSTYILTVCSPYVLLKFSCAYLTKADENQWKQTADVLDMEERSSTIVGLQARFGDEPLEL